ncbi:hypothetical protein SAY87_002640 [Trapa incisa]|uniref:Sucrose-phosphatase n=1 Tax=Trapa incisa TaxID=236973 RepID=A0AAN7JUS0_9MYRT|nr:hypothetical protein SAY87_002640 [Trapa incisa]
MDRFDGPADLMIVSDLDFTMVDHNDPENLSLLRFNALWEAYYRSNSLLVYSTGRSATIYEQLRKEKPLASPDIAIMSVGTEITYGESTTPDDEWKQYLNQKWDRDIVVEETDRFPQLTSQPETEQRPHKVSFFVEKDDASEVIDALSQRLEKRGLDVKLLYSNGIALDVLPRGAGKGKALTYLMGKLKARRKLPFKTLVCGDSGNDTELFTVPLVYGVVVSNAQEELLHWYEANAKNNPNIIHAKERCALGIIQAIGIFSLGPNVSPRSITDFHRFRVEASNPEHEVVKFYLFYERWRRAEVARSSLDTLKLSFYSPGISVHPSGCDRSFSQCIEEMNAVYGDKQGKHFQVWVDRVLSSQIGSELWLVKFDKWESYGEYMRRAARLPNYSIAYFKGSFPVDPYASDLG